MKKLIKLFLYNILEFLGFGWIEYYGKFKITIRPNYIIPITLFYRNNKYTNKWQKKTNKPTCNGYDYNEWFTVRKNKVPKNLILNK
jgi:hypothetical protein